MTGIRCARVERVMREDAADAAALRHLLAEVRGDSLRRLRERGLELHLGATKTDHTGRDTTIEIPERTRIRPKALLFDRIAAMRAAEAGTARTPAKEVALPLFRRLTRGDALTPSPMSDKAVAGLVKRYAAAAGYDAIRFSGHSLRAGFLTEAASPGRDGLQDAGGKPAQDGPYPVRLCPLHRALPRPCGRAVSAGGAPAGRVM